MKITKRKDRNLYSTSIRKPDGTYKKIYGKTKKEVREKADSLNFKFQSGDFVEDNNITLCSWLDEWMDSYLIDIKETTQISYKGVIRNHIKPYFKRKRLQKLTHNDIQRFIQSLSKKLSPKTVHNVYLVLHRSLKDAMINGYISSNPSDNVILPKKNKPIMNVLDVEQIKQLLKIAYEQEPEYADCFEFLILTGLRIGELVGLTIDSYNPETRELKIYQQYNPTLKIFTSPKNDKVRLLILGDREHEILMERIKTAKRIMGKFKQANKNNLIFLNPSFDMLKETTMRKVLKRISSQIGVPNLRLHDLRHTNATLALASGVDIKTVQEILGHQDATFTMNKYAHSTNLMKKYASEKINDFLY